MSPPYPPSLAASPAVTNAVEGRDLGHFLGRADRALVEGVVGRLLAAPAADARSDPAPSRPTCDRPAERCPPVSILRRSRTRPAVCRRSCRSQPGEPGCEHRGLPHAAAPDRQPYRPALRSGEDQVFPRHRVPSEVLAHMVGDERRDRDRAPAGPGLRRADVVPARHLDQDLGDVDGPPQQVDPVARRPKSSPARIRRTRPATRGPGSARRWRPPARRPLTVSGSASRPARCGQARTGARVRKRYRVRRHRGPHHLAHDLGRLHHRRRCPPRRGQVRDPIRGTARWSMSGHPDIAEPRKDHRAQVRVVAGPCGRPPARRWCAASPPPTRRTTPARGPGHTSRLEPCSSPPMPARSRRRPFGRTLSTPCDDDRRSRSTAPGSAPRAACAQIRSGVCWANRDLLHGAGRLEYG